jgi:hypothetical protein
MWTHEPLRLVESHARQCGAQPCCGNTLTSITQAELFNRAFRVVVRYRAGDLPDKAVVWLKECTDCVITFAEG